MPENHKKCAFSTWVRTHAIHLEWLLAYVELFENHYRHFECPCKVATIITYILLRLQNYLVPRHLPPIMAQRGKQTKVRSYAKFNQSFSLFYKMNVFYLPASSVVAGPSLMQALIL
jgi:hypothetical protein